jgi:hypothetical protein
MQLVQQKIRETCADNNVTNRPCISTHSKRKRDGAFLGSRNHVPFIRRSVIGYCKQPCAEMSIVRLNTLQVRSERSMKVLGYFPTLDLRDLSIIFTSSTEHILYSC